jgi:hypothetical protein
MKTIAKALIETAASLELSGEDVIGLDGSVKAIEDLAHTLKSASPEELAAMRLALQELTAAENAGLKRPEVLEFCEHFLENLGVAA